MFVVITLSLNKSGRLKKLVKKGADVKANSVVTLIRLLRSD